MAKITSKLQVTIPKRVADEYGLAPGDEIEFVLAAGALRVIRARQPSREQSVGERLALFEAATARQRVRQRGKGRRAAEGSRGWTRESLYDRDRAR